MPTSDLDMPLLPSAEQIRRREFATVRRGYDPQQVRTYLTSIANQVETLERELSQFRLEAGSAAARTEQGPKPFATPATSAPVQDQYEALSKRFATLIEVADQEAQKALEDAQAEATLALDEARGEADRIKVDAQSHAEGLRQEGTDLLERARDESERILSTLADRRRALVGQLEGMRSKLLAAADDLAEPLEEAIRAEAEDAEARSSDEVGDSGTDGDHVDPRYEDLWVSEEQVDIPDLASIDLDFDDEDQT
jgi:DivIVA domain-containing protein